MLCLTWVSLNSAYAAKLEVPKNKAGATHHTYSTGEFTLSSQSTSDSGAASVNLIGFALFYERLFLDRFSAGFKYGFGLERSQELEVGTSTLKVLETASFWALEFRAYISDNLNPGFKPFMGVSYANYTVKSAISILPASGSITEDETSASIPVTVLSFGADYTFGFGGIRLEIGQATGKRNDLESSTDYYASYIYDGSIIGISVYSFF